MWINVSPDDTTTGEVGYWLLPAARGIGLMTRAVVLIASWAPTGVGLTEILLRTAADNARSSAVAIRSGFRPAGTHRRRLDVDGRRFDEVVYTLELAEVATRPWAE